MITTMGRVLVSTVLAGVALGFTSCGGSPAARSVTGMSAQWREAYLSFGERSRDAVPGPQSGEWKLQSGRRRFRCVGDFLNSGPSW